MVGLFTLRESTDTTSQVFPSLESQMLNIYQHTHHWAEVCSVKEQALYLLWKGMGGRERLLLPGKNKAKVFLLSEGAQVR